MTEIPPEALAIAATATGHTVGCTCPRCGEIREVAAWGALVDRVMDEWDRPCENCNGVGTVGVAVVFDPHPIYESNPCGYCDDTGEQPHLQEPPQYGG